MIVSLALSRPGCRLDWGKTHTAIVALSVCVSVCVCLSFSLSRPCMYVYVRTEKKRALRAAWTIGMQGVATRQARSETIWAELGFVGPPMSSSPVGFVLPPRRDRSA
ncbi:hypothetical protein M440DRAFT_1397494 [Trichoderma longibrachiatum ATCC 18648]|uniref:Uncharacterized protein n=1 Tax=Trichoderma longibrachiatum ATCC 18648 TaxID=983965 RepID=A0A2T4CF33_TRILO|nr:hypothetical protein M440DRAFT_1397494 [Trichoderma longibrachiatum ATCC 18648]